MRTLYLLRHPAVSEEWHQRCYGKTDVPLAPGWTRPELPKPDRIYHSGVSRTRLVAEEIGHHHGCEVIADHRLAERDFGDWEGKSWGEIYAESGDAMMKMIHEPATWRAPGHGETTFEVRDRMLAWFAELPRSGVIVAVTHGGAIASLLGVLRQWPVSEWLTLIPKWGEVVKWEDKV
jgi:alpha-ribazole phosphatase